MSEHCCEPQDISKRLAKILVTKMPDGTPVTCGSLWANQPVLLCMFRRWGCGICRMSAANISAAAPLLAKKNVKVVGFGIETLGFEDFYKGKYFTGDLFVDSDGKAYSALKLRKNSWRNLWGLMGGSIMDLFDQSKKKGFENNLKGNLTQLGGTFLIMPDGTVPYAHFQSNDSFEPDLLKIMEVLGLIPPTDYEMYPSYATCQNRSACS
jgi:peroxiredoxin